MGQVAPVRAPAQTGDVIVADTKVYLPKQNVRRGVAGYRGKDVVVVDPATGKQAKAPETREQDAAEATKRRSTKAEDK